MWLALLKSISILKCAKTDNQAMTHFVLTVLTTTFPRFFQLPTILSLLIFLNIFFNHLFLQNHFLIKKLIIYIYIYIFYYIIINIHMHLIFLSNLSTKFFLIYLSFLEKYNQILVISILLL